VDLLTAAGSVRIDWLIERLTGNKVSATNGNICCPLGTHSDSTPSFHIYSDAKSFYCFSCKEHGNAITLYQKLTGVYDPLDAAKDICELAEFSDDPPEVKGNYKMYTDVYEYCVDLFQNSYAKRLSGLPAEEFERSFFIRRGFESLIDKYGLGYCPPFFKNSTGIVLNFKDILRRKFPDIPESELDSFGLYDASGSCVFNDRYVFTLYDAYHKPIGFSARTLRVGVAKYINTKETPYFKKSEFLYNWDVAKKYSQVFVLEGLTDVLSLVAAGIPNAVAPLGTAFTAQHAKMLESKEVVLLMDRDKAGCDALISTAKKYPRIYKAILDFPNKDANDALRAGHDLKELLKHPRYLPEFLLHHAAVLYDLSNAEGREKLYADLNELSKPYSPIVRDSVFISFQKLIIERLINGLNALLLP